MLKTKSPEAPPTAPAMKLLDDRVLVRRDTKEDKTPGGLLLPDTAKERPQRGTVLAVGPGKPHRDREGRMPMQVKAGDRVLFPRYAGGDVPGYDDLLFLREEDILAVLL